MNESKEQPLQNKLLFPTEGSDRSSEKLWIDDRSDESIETDSSDGGVMEIGRR